MYIYAMDFSSYEPFGHFVMCPCPRARFETGKNAKWQKERESNTHTGHEHACQSII